jgi:AcrR family transcriptional regulator
MTQPPAQTHPKRRRDAAATRSAIFEAATRRFAYQGYQCAGVREIAADAGVDAAMVNRYFGSKEGLFAEVIRRALDMGHLLQGQRGDLADHLARVMVYGQEDSQDWGYTPLLLLLHSATVPGALKLFRRDLDGTELPLLAEKIGGDDAAVRAVMVMAQLTGFAIMYHVLRPKAFAKARGEDLVTLLSGAVAACIK